MVMKMPGSSASVSPAHQQWLSSGQHISSLVPPQSASKQLWCRKQWCDAWPADEHAPESPAGVGAPTAMSSLSSTMSRRSWAISPLSPQPQASSAAGATFAPGSSERSLSRRLTTCGCPTSLTYDAVVKQAFYVHGLRAIQGQGAVSPPTATAGFRRCFSSRCVLHTDCARHRCEACGRWGCWPHLGCPLTTGMIGQRRPTQGAAFVYDCLNPLQCAGYTILCSPDRQHDAKSRSATFSAHISRPEVAQLCVRMRLHAGLQDVLSKTTCPMLATDARAMANKTKPMCIPVWTEVLHRWPARPKHPFPPSVRMTRVTSWSVCAVPWARGRPRLACQGFQAGGAGHLRSHQTATCGLEFRYASAGAAERVCSCLVADCQAAYLSCCNAPV